MDATFITQPELFSFLIAEKMNEGYILYKDIDANIGIFSGIVFQGVTLVFGRSVHALQVISMLLVFFQALFFNEAINRMDVLNQRTLFPGFVYIILSSMFYDFQTLSPVLMANTCLVGALYIYLKITKQGAKDESVFNIGLLIGVAVLFYHPVFVFFPFFMLFMLLFSDTGLPKYLVLIFGFLFPIVLCGVYYYWHDSLSDFLLFTLYYPFYIDKIEYFSFSDYAILFSIPVTISVLGLLRLLNSGGFTNYQSISHRFVIGWAIFGFFTLFLSRQLSVQHFIIFLIPFSFFITSFFYMIKRGWAYELYSWVLLGAIVFGWMSVGDNWVSQKGWIRTDDWQVDVTKETPKYGKVLVLGEDPNVFLTNKIATRYVQWQIAKDYFEDLNRFSHITHVYKNMSIDLPDAIVDKNKLVKKLFFRLPALEKLYEKSPTDRNVYLLKKSR